MRITAKILRNMVGYLNDSIGNVNEVIALDQAYGGYQLVIVHMLRKRAESDLSRRLNGREMYELLYTLREFDLRNLLKPIGKGDAE